MSPHHSAHASRLLSDNAVFLELSERGPDQRSHYGLTPKTAVGMTSPLTRNSSLYAPAGSLETGRQSIVSIKPADCLGKACFFGTGAQSNRRSWSACIVCGSAVMLCSQGETKNRLRMLLLAALENVRSYGSVRSGSHFGSLQAQICCGWW